MSYDLYLCDPVSKETINVEEAHFMRGGTYEIGGTKELHLNITYNYAPIYCREDVLGENGIKSLIDLTGAQSIPILQKAIAVLNDDVNPDYWSATEGNAKRALLQLLSMAYMRPDGVWEVDC